MIPPRWGTPRDVSRETRLPELEAVAEAFGVELFAWQRLVAEVALEVENGRYAWRNVGVGVGRQNGKTALAALRIGMELAQPGRKVIMTAQDRMMAREKWAEHCAMIEESTLEVKRKLTGAGFEKLEMANGSTYTVFTPTGKGARGLTVDLVIIDEALTHDLRLIQAVEPTMATRPDGQMWLVSNAGDADSTMLDHYRKLGHDPDAAAKARLAWFEWAPHADRFDPSNPEVWYQAIPTLAEELGVVEDAVAQAVASQPPEVFAKEWLNVWPALGAASVIDPDRWEACLRPEVMLPPAGIMFGLDVSPDRDAAAVVAAGVSMGRYVVEVVDARPGVGWVHERLVELCARHRAPVVIDGGTNPSGAFIAPLEAAGVDVHTIKLRDYVNACSMFFDAVENDTLAHNGDARLTDAAVAAGRRKLGDAWAWQRRGEVDMTPLIAATLAHYGAVTVRAPTPAIH